jgi:hypothetical protein
MATANGTTILHSSNYLQYLAFQKCIGRLPQVLAGHEGAVPFISIPSGYQNDTRPQPFSTSLPSNDKALCNPVILGLGSGSPW